MSTRYDSSGYFELEDDPVDYAQAFGILLTGAVLVATSVAVYFLIFILGQYGR